MSLKPGDTLALQFTTTDPTTGGAASATGTPTAKLVRNGVDDGAVTLTVDITNAPVYKVSGTIPSGYAAGDVLQVRVTATVGGVTNSGYPGGSIVLDSKRVGELHDPTVAQIQSGLALESDLTTALTDLGTLLGRVTGAVALATDMATTLTDLGTLLTRVTAARAGYWDNLNVGGPVMSHADGLALNQSASKHLILTTVQQYAPGEAYTVELRTFDAVSGAAVNADSTPTITPMGAISGNLSANLGAVTNAATGVYRATYTPGATPTLEQIRFDGSATIATMTFTLSCYAQTVDEPTATFTTTDKNNLTAIVNKLPSAAFLAGTSASGGAVDAVKAKTDLIATNGGDSPAAATAQTTISTNLNATVGSRSTFAGGAVLSVTNPVTVGTNNDKAGYGLAANGLDVVSTVEPSGSANGWNFRHKILALFGRKYNKNIVPKSGNGDWVTMQRDGTTPMATQAMTDDGTTQTLNGA